MKEIKIDGEVFVKKSDVKNKTEWKVPAGDKSNPFMELGRIYHVETVTKYFVGKLVWVGDKEMAFEKAAWVADTGRYNEYAIGKTVNEVEPLDPDTIVIIGRGSLIDMWEKKSGLLLDVK